jgi:hypothetical protein
MLKKLAHNMNLAAAAAKANAVVAKAKAEAAKVKAEAELAAAIEAEAAVKAAIKAAVKAQASAKDEATEAAEAETEAETEATDATEAETETEAAEAAEVVASSYVRGNVTSHLKFIEAAKKIGEQCKGKYCGRALLTMGLNLQGYVEADQVLARATPGSSKAAKALALKNDFADKYRRATRTGHQLAKRILIRVILTDGDLKMGPAATALLNSTMVVTDCSLQHERAALHANPPPQNGLTPPPGFFYIGRVRARAPGPEAATVGCNDFEIPLYACRDHPEIVWCNGIFFRFSPRYATPNIAEINDRGGYCTPFLVAQRICLCDQPLGKPEGTPCRNNLACSKGNGGRTHGDPVLRIYDPLWPERKEQLFFLQRMRSKDGIAIKSCAGCGMPSRTVGGVRTFKACEGCVQVLNSPAVLYCTPQCQRAHWKKEHKRFCCNGLPKKPSYIATRAIGAMAAAIAHKRVKATESKSESESAAI